MRTKKLMLRLTEKEYLDIKTKAEAKGLSMAAYMRMLATDTGIK